MTDGRLVLLSLERWDDVWRRNQHLASALLRLGLVDRILFVEPPDPEHLEPHDPLPGLTVVRPPLLWPPRYGSIPIAATWVRRRHLQHGDRIWVNNAPLGRWMLRHAVIYDVTDDWRESLQGTATRRRLIRAEDLLARRVPTVVCSDELRRRWKDRYQVSATIVSNAIDHLAFAQAQPKDLPGGGPHAMYVGTLHDERIDVELCLQVAGSVGTLHLIGPDLLSEAARRRLRSHPRIRLWGPIPSSEVPSHLVSADVLVVPHVVSAFTLSLDAIKAYEYLATDRPVVATPASGFQGLTAPGLAVASGTSFVEHVTDFRSLRFLSRAPVPTWEERAQQMAQLLVAP